MKFIVNALRGAVFTLLASAPAIADTWTSLGLLSVLPSPAGGTVSETCQYRLQAISGPSIYIDVARALPGALYLDQISIERTSVNFGESVSSRNADLELVEDLSRGGFFKRSRDASGLVAILKSQNSRLLSHRLVVNQQFSTFEARDPGATIALTVSYLSGRRTIRKSFALRPDAFVLEASCPTQVIAHS